MALTNDKPSQADISDAGDMGPLIDLAADRSYFFDTGLLFECQRCGDCCTGAPGTIYVGPEEIAPIAEHRRLSQAELISVYLYPFKDSFSIAEDAQGRCLFFDAGCTIYEVRPLQCRSFPFWFCNLRSQVRWDRVCRQCPGIGRGRRYAKEEILALAQRTAHL